MLYCKNVHLYTLLIIYLCHTTNKLFMVFRMLSIFIFISKIDKSVTILEEFVFLCYKVVSKPNNNLNVRQNITFCNQRLQALIFSIIEQSQLQLEVPVW